MKYFVREAALATLIFMSANSHALITPILTKELFDTTVSLLAIDTYNDLTPGPFATLPNPLPRTAVSAVASYTYEASADGVSLFVAGSSGDPFLSTNEDGDSLVFSNFSNGISAIGGFFFGTDIEGNFVLGQELWVEASNNSESLSVLLIGLDETSFIGFDSDTPLVSLRVTPVLSTVFSTVNDLRLANPSAVMGVPEPGTLALIAVALIGCCLNARRR